MKANLIRRLIITFFVFLLIGFPGCEKSDRPGPELSEARQLRKEGKFKEALPVLEKLLAEKREKDTLLQAQCWVEKGLNYWNLGETAEAEKAFEQAMKLSGGQDANLNDYARKVLQIINVYKIAAGKKAEKKYDEAELLLKQAIELSRKYGFKELELKCTYKLAYVYLYKKEIRKFLTYLNECVSISEYCVNDIIIIDCLLNLGHYSFNNQDLWKSYNYFDRAKFIAEKGNFVEDFPDLFFDLGIVFYCFGQYDLAEYYLEKSLRIYNKKQELESIISGLAALALCIYKNQKINGLFFRAGQAEELFDRALELSLKAGFKPMEARIINNLAYVYLDRDLGRTQEYATRALHLGQSLNDEEVVAASFSNLAEVFLRKNQVLKAAAYFKKSLQIALVSGYWTEVWNDFAGLARCQEKLGDFSLAIAYYQKALQTLGKLRNNINLDLFRIGFDLEKKDVYEGIIRSLVNLKAKKNSAELEDLIFASVKEIKARVFLEEMLKHDDQNQLSEPSKELLALDGSIMELVTNHRNLPKDEIRPEVQELEHRYLKSLASKSQSNDQAKYDSRPVTLKEVRAECKNNNQVILDYYLGRDESYCFFIDKDRYQPFKLASETEVEKDIKLYIKLLSQPEIPAEELKRAGKKVRELLLPEEILRSLTGKRLIIIPDGLLHYLPFETLVLTEGPNKEYYLIEKYPVSYLPSLAALSRMRERRERTFRKKFLGVGNPAYEPEQKSWLDSYLNLQSNGWHRVSNLSPLPYSQVELKEIAGFFPAGDFDLLLKKRASEENLKKTDLRDYQVIHFACHGVADEENPLRSSLLLRPGQHGQEDGFLTVREIYNLRLASDLVVLSACESSRGTVIKKEGVIGFPRLFLLIGSRSVLSTLWSVNDKTTSEFMKLFYRELLAGQDKDESLRKAKIGFITSANYHPYYWAPFILSGDSSRIY